MHSSHFRYISYIPQETVTIVLAVSIFLTGNVKNMCSRKSIENAFKIGFKDKTCIIKTFR